MNGKSWVTVTRGRRATMFPIQSAVAGMGKSAAVVGPVVFVGCITDGPPHNLVRMELTIEAATKLAADLNAVIEQSKSGGGQ